MTLVRAVDISSYQRVPDADWWPKLRAQYGVGLAIISSADGGARPNPWFKANAENALRGGLDLATYCWPPEAVETALDNCIGYMDDLTAFWLDIEAGRGVTQANVDAVRAKRIPVGIYSSRSQWPACMGQSTAFRDLPLWDASYSDSWSERNWPESEIVDWFSPYGGWNYRMGYQCRGDITVLGVRCDLSVFEEGIVGLTEDRAREIAREEAAKAVTTYNSAHYEDDHQWLGVYRDATKRIRRFGEEAVRAAMTRVHVREFRREIQHVPLAAGATPEPAPEAEE